MKKLVPIAALLALTQVALAHTRLAESVPADTDTLDRAPTEIVLVFSDPVRLTALALEQADGTQHALAPLPKAPSERFAVPAPEPLGPGAYTVTWRALAADTHVMSGEFGFSIDAAAESLRRSTH